MKLRLLLLLAPAILVAEVAISTQNPLVGRDRVIDLVDGAGQRAFESIARQIAGDRYNPGSYAWGWQYHARGCLIMFNVTGERKWLDWALNITDLFLEYSDVNGDGVPAWGNYNETWGNDRYEFREYTVWDGVIGLPMIEAAKVIKGSPDLHSNASLAAKADAYVALIERIVQRHHGAWTQVSSDQGYYWDDPNQDVGPIVNRFTALGRVELILADVTGNRTYLDRPRQMASYMIANMRHNEAGDLYTWEYWFGQGGSEDISHGAIELEFLIMASERGLLDPVHLRRLANTYLKRIWQVPLVLDGKHILAFRVDGSDHPDYDYARISRGWILLAPYNPSVYEFQRTALGVLHEKSGIYPSSVSLLGLAQIPLTANRLVALGIDPEELRSVDLETLASMLERAYDLLEAARALGSGASTPAAQLNEAGRYREQDQLGNASIAIGLILKAWEMLGRIKETGERLLELENDVGEALSLQVNVTRLLGNLTALRSDFAAGESNAQLDSVDARIETLMIGVRVEVVAALIAVAEDVISRAKALGIDTSRHEIFLRRAKEEFDKGNYASARYFTEYPIALAQQIAENLPFLAMCVFALATGKFIFIDRFLQGTAR